MKHVICSRNVEDTSFVVHFCDEVDTDDNDDDHVPKSPLKAKRGPNRTRIRKEEFAYLQGGVRIAS